MNTMPRTVTDTRELMLKTARELREHRKGGPLSLGAANYLSTMIRLWRQDPTATALDFNAWLRRNQEDPPHPIKRPVVRACEFAIGELWPLPLPHYIATTQGEAQ